MVDVSVVINAYKRRSFVKEAIISAALQNVPKDRYEIILVTDLNDEELQPSGALWARHPLLQ